MLFTRGLLLYNQAYDCIIIEALKHKWKHFLQISLLLKNNSKYLGKNETQISTKQGQNFIVNFESTLQ